MTPRRRVGLALVALVAVGVAASMLPVADWLLALVAWVRDAGALGVVVFGVAYALAVVLFVPGSALTLGAGFVWGPVGGLVVVSPASVLGATLAFLLGRTLLRDRVEVWITGDPRFRAVDTAVAEQGLWIVLLLRLSPVFPFILLNYALGLTAIRTGPYVLASFLGMLPATLLFTYLGSTVSQLATLSTGETPQDPAVRWLYWGGLLATLAVTVLVTRVATRALREAVDLESPPPSEETA